MLLHWLLIHHKQFIEYLYGDGLDIQIINPHMFCLPVLHLRTHLFSERHPGTSHQLLQQGMCILLHTFLSQSKGQITVIRRPLLNEVSLIRKICKV